LKILFFQHPAAFSTWLNEEFESELIAAVA
jgi:hypothetical protein